jgi:hypothetical protein
MGETLGNPIAKAGGSIILVILLVVLTGFSQSQALDGQIEGTVVDQSSASVPNATVTATNIGTGAFRTVTTDEDGIYRIPLLPLGTYRITIEAPGFRRYVREDISLATGQSATVDLQLEPGQLSETVTISQDAPVADSGKTDLGRVMNKRDVHNLPLPTRNPYNFIILQANVNGRPNRGFNFPQVNVNGFARRVNYLLDGNTNTRGDRAGARLLSISDTYVNEIQLLTNSFAAEFGNTTGMIVNMVTPSGTNDLHGSVSYLFRRPSFYSRPFFFSAPELPDNITNNVAATIGGPVMKDRWHFYLGYEYIQRDDSTRANRQVTISEENKATLIGAGLPASIFVPAIPSQEYGAHYIARTDLLSGNNRLTARFNHSNLATRNNIAGLFNTMERSIDITATDRSLGVQLVSYTTRWVNELRFQFAQTQSDNLRNNTSGTGPSVTITSVANFGSPTDAGAADLTTVSQLQNNFSITRDARIIKFGGGISYVHLDSRAATSSLYTFGALQAYLDARAGSQPRGYERYSEWFGDPEIELDTTYWNFFVQDDWKATSRLKLSYGLRYDLYLPPTADAAAPFSASREFNQDLNNFAPRLGLAYTLREGDRPLVLRAGAGIYYEPPFSDLYKRALQNNGVRFFNLQFCGLTSGPQQCAVPLGPEFPGTFSGSQPTTGIPAQNIVTVSPDFVNMYAIHSHVQLEQALTEDLALAVGYVHSAGRHIPVYRSINPITPDRLLADGRPVFGPARLDDRFNQIQMAESAAVSQYDALTVQLNRRFSRGFQFNANYTLSRSVDDAPEQNVTYMGGIGGVTVTSLVLSDPTNRSFDKGYSYGDQRHTFVMSLVARPTFNLRNRTLSRLLSNNQFGVIATANSGERFSILAGRESDLQNLDLNRDGISSADRPVGIKRNSGRTPPQFNLDLRYSRFLNLTDRYKLELLGEVQNLFNVKSIIGYNSVNVRTNSVTGEMIGPIPDFRSRNTTVALESRQLQIGVKFLF